MQGNRNRVKVLRQNIKHHMMLAWFLSTVWPTHSYTTQRVLPQAMAFQELLVHQCHCVAFSLSGWHCLALCVAVVWLLLQSTQASTVNFQWHSQVIVVEMGNCWRLLFTWQLRFSFTVMSLDWSRVYHMS